MIVKDGEKFACEACIRGHRVSSCSHKDRKLNHVNKKGRPVSQCQHCRGLRKARASHVKCDCGAENGSRITTLDSGEEDSEDCHCQTGVRCTCALKKDHTDSSEPLVPLQRSASIVKPILPHLRSETTVPRLRTTHPPTHRSNHAAHEHGQPYTVPKSRPMSSGRSSITSLDSRGGQTFHPASVILHETQVAEAAPLAANSNTEAELASAPPSNHIRSSTNHIHRELNASYPSLGAFTDSDLAISANPSGNVNRSSINDFSMFTLDGMAGSQTQVPHPGSSVDNTIGPLSWPNWDVDNGTFDFVDLGFNGIPMTPTESAEHSIALAPGLSRTSSGTNSDAEDHLSHYSDFTFDPTTFAGWEMPASFVPDLTANAFDADLESYVNVSSDAADMLPNELMLPYDLNGISQQLSMSGLTEQQQQPMATSQYPPTYNGPFMPLQMSSSMKDEDVRQWLSQDQAGELQFAGMVQQGQGQQQQGADDVYAMNEPTWF